MQVAKAGMAFCRLVPGPKVKHTFSYMRLIFNKNTECAEFLENTIGNEKAAENLQSIPYHYMELAQLILTNFKDEFTETDKILALLQVSQEDGRYPPVLLTPKSMQKVEHYLI